MLREPEVGHRVRVLVETRPVSAVEAICAIEQHPWPVRDRKTQPVEMDVTHGK